MRSVFVAVFLLLAFQGAHGEVPSGLAKVLKQNNPNELAYSAVAAPDCAVSQAEVNDLVKGILVRSRIKPLKGGWSVKKLYLSVRVNCVKTQGNNPVYSASVFFGDSSGDTKILFDRNFGGLGIGNSDFIKQAVKEMVEDAVTVYLEANFDLGD